MRLFYPREAETGAGNLASTGVVILKDRESRMVETLAGEELFLESTLNARPSARLNVTYSQS